MASTKAINQIIELKHPISALNYKLDPKYVSNFAIDKDMVSGTQTIKFTVHNPDIAQVFQTHGHSMTIEFMGVEYKPVTFTINQNVGEYMSLFIEAISYAEIGSFPKKVVFDSPYGDEYGAYKSPMASLPLKVKFTEPLPVPEHQFEYKGIEPYFVGSLTGIPSQTGGGRLYVVMMGAVMVRMELMEPAFKGGVTGVDTKYLAMRVSTHYPNHQSVSKIHKVTLKKKVSEYAMEDWEIVGSAVHAAVKQVDVHLRYKNQISSESVYHLSVKNMSEFPKTAFEELPHEPHMYEPTAEWWIDFTTPEGQFLKREKTKKQYILKTFNPYYCGKKCWLTISEISASGIIKHKTILGPNSLYEYEKKKSKGISIC